MNVPMLAEMAADSLGDRVAVGRRGAGWTYDDLYSSARRAATVITAEGAERVVLVDVNSEAVPLLLFGSGIAGVPFVPVNYRLPDAQLCAILARTAPALAVGSEPILERIAGVEGITALSRDELHERVAKASPAEPDFVDPADIAVLLYTSGTTGDPKAAVLRHRHLASYVISTVEFAGAGDHHAALVSVPPYHVAGVATILTSVYGGRRLVYLPQFDPGGWVDLARSEAITHALVVPTMLGRILDVVEDRGEQLPALVHLAYGGGRMPVPVIERAMALLPHVGFVNAYGLTETSSTISVLGPDDHRQALASSDPDVRARLGSVGRPLPSVEVEIRGPDDGPLPAGQRGEVCVRGEQISGEYLEGSAVGPDGWFTTNDGGWLDDAGYLFVEGRLDDVIVRGAENISPGEIEDVLLDHPAVADAAVVGIPDQEWGEAIAAAVVLEPGTTASQGELADWIRARLRSSRAPAVVQIRDHLPYNETGKLLRRVLRAELASQANTSSARSDLSL
ncbi:MAG: class I adenylate-forming enzyme family protein [Acidimicrobiia bacterium]